jgi:hypothetical protein
VRGKRYIAEAFPCCAGVRYNMLCAFAHQFPFFVERFLDQGRALRRRFREETVTDLMMGGLITAGGGRLIVEFPDEPATGADMEWNFVDQRKSTFFRLLLQAKQAYGDGAVWTRHCYRELLHTSGAGSKLQAEVLCDTARLPGSATYPFYIFYHSAHTCALARRAGDTVISGINIADGFVVERLAKAATTRALRISNKSLRVIAPKLSPLSALFCPPTILPAPPFAFAPSGISPPMYLSVGAGGRGLGFALPPTPDEVRTRVARLRAAASSTPIADAQRDDGGLPDVPGIGRRIPDDVQAVLNRASARAEPGTGLDRWRLTFVSDSPPLDER